MKFAPDRRRPPARSLPTASRPGDPSGVALMCPLGEVRDPITAGRLKRLGVMAGFPDLMFVGPGARTVFLEWKRRGGRLNDAQAAMKQHLVNSGFDYLMTDDIDQAVGWLQSRGILRGGVVLIG